LVKVALKRGVRKGMGGWGNIYGGYRVLWPLCVFECIFVVVVEVACIRDFSWLKFSSSLYFPPPLCTVLHHSWNSFNSYHFYIYVHVYTIFAPCSPSYILSMHLPPIHWKQTPPPLARSVSPSCSPILYKKRRRRKRHFGLRKHIWKGAWHSSVIRMTTGTWTFNLNSLYFSIKLLFIYFWWYGFLFKALSLLPLETHPCPIVALAVFQMESYSFPRAV
jgi:hypothetical protein